MSSAVNLSVPILLQIGCARIKPPVGSDTGLVLSRAVLDVIVRLNRLVKLLDLLLVKRVKSRTLPIGLCAIRGLSNNTLGRY